MHREIPSKFLHTHYDAIASVSVMWLCGGMRFTNHPGAFRFPFAIKKM